MKRIFTASLLFSLTSCLHSMEQAPKQQEVTFFGNMSYYQNIEQLIKKISQELKIYRETQNLSLASKLQFFIKFSSLYPLYTSKALETLKQEITREREKLDLESYYCGLGSKYFD